jgi:hypothetical protein
MLEGYKLMAWKETDSESTPGVTYEREVEGPKDSVDLGDYFYALHEKCKGDPAARTAKQLYFAITRKPGTLRDRGERKIHRKLPSGMEVRIWRENEAKKHPLLRQAQPGDKGAESGAPTNRHEHDKKESHEYVLEARDAVFLARHPNVFIEPTRGRIEVSDQDLNQLRRPGEGPIRVEDPKPEDETPKVCQKCGGKLLGGKKGFDHLEDCPYHRK